MDPSNALLRSFQTCLDDREAKGHRRRLKVLPSNSVDFSSNDFLSLSTSPGFRSHFLRELAFASSSYPLGSKGSRLLDGNSTYAEDLECFVASFHQAESGLLFNSGYDANLAIFSCIPQPGDIVLYDELIHASIHDGMRLSRAGKRISFKHNSVDNFAEVLRKLIDNDPMILAGERNVFIAVESLYSMDGDFAPIVELLETLETLLPNGNGHMIVDEAHSTGVFGPRGSGIVQELEVQNRVLIRLHTFGKALASHGAIVLCSPLTREYLINYARSLIYTTSLSLSSLVSIRAVYESMDQGITDSLRSDLHRLVEYLRTELEATVQTGDRPVLRLCHHHRSPIFSIQTPFPRELASFLQAAGQVVRAIMPPTVAAGTERVRICLHARNTVKEIDGLVSLIRKWARQHDDSQASML